MSRAFLLAVLFLCTVFMAGCHTVSGAASGAAVGAQKDYQEAQKADVWLQKNLW